MWQETFGAVYTSSGISLTLKASRIVVIYIVHASARLLHPGGTDTFRPYHYTLTSLSSTLSLCTSYPMDQAEDPVDWEDEPASDVLQFSKRKTGKKKGKASALGSTPLATPALTEIPLATRETLFQTALLASAGGTPFEDVKFFAFSRRRKGGIIDQPLPLLANSTCIRKASSHFRYRKQLPQYCVLARALPDHGITQSSPRDSRRAVSPIWTLLIRQHVRIARHTTATTRTAISKTKQPKLL